MTPTDMRKMYEGYVEALNAHAFDRLDQFINDEVIYFTDTVTRDQVAGALTSEVDKVPNLSWEITDMSVDGNDIAARLINRGTPAKEWLGVAPTGASFEIVEYAIYRLRDGRFETMTNLHDGEALKQQLGA